MKRFISRYKKALIENEPVIAFQSRLPAHRNPIFCVSILPNAGSQRSGRGGNAFREQNLILSEPGLSDGNHDDPKDDDAENRPVGARQSLVQECARSEYGHDRVRGDEREHHRRRAP
jgi:hypothetical protein